MPPAPRPPQPANRGPDNCLQNEDNSVKASGVSLTGWDYKESSVKGTPLAAPWRPAA